MDELTWTPITVRLSALDFWERNPKRLTKAQAKRLADSTDRLGRAGVLLVGPQDARGRYPLYDGHQRANIWRTLYGADAEVHALQSNRELSEDERLSVSVLTVTAVGSFDFDALAGWDTTILRNLGLGVDYKRELDDAAANIAAMLEAIAADAAPVADVAPQLDRAEELQERWQVQPGDVWQMGEHRLICGDCTDKAVVERVMGGERVSLIVTDPPYGVNYDGGANNETKREKLTGDLDAELYDKFLQVAPTNNECALYMWHAGRRANEVYEAAIKNGFEIRSQIIWHKLKAHYGAWMAQYKQKHEPCIYCVKGAPTFSGATNEVTVWEYEQPSKNEFHPTQKPIELMERAIGNHPYLTVYEPFLGSGTTLIACERLGRKCRAVEISPAYVAVTLQRWADATGRTPVRLENAKWTKG